MKLTASAGKYSLNVDNKVTPTEMLFQRTYCKDTNDCKSAKFHSVVKHLSKPLKLHIYYFSL